MATILVLIILLSVILLIVGLIKPSLVIRWGEEEGKTRKQVVKLFLALFITANVIGVLTADGPSNKNKNNKEKVETQVASDKDNNDLKVVEEKDGFVTYSDGSVIRETMGGTFKWTAAYKEIEKKEKKMEREEQYNILGEDKLMRIENEILADKKVNEVVDIAKKCGVNPRMYKGKYSGGLNSVYIVRAKKGVFKDDIQYGVKFSEVADIRKANPDTVIEEMKSIIEKLAKNMPDYVEIELNRSTQENSKPIGELKEITPGDISEISLVYHKKSNVITKMVSVTREPTENKVRGAIYVLHDVVK